ncbi:MAG TPA: branched-chain amino acid ABC transporter permease, partial [Thermoanaerobaculia bacterium]|nr:branched-chain amino acid ABC transporter permease [Thermoanaerobaculia bacterium]
PGIVFGIEHISIMMILVTMLGGAATLWGPVVGAAIYILVAEIFRVYVGSGHLIFFGILIIVIILFFPNGIVGTLADWRLRKQRRVPAEKAVAA